MIDPPPADSGSRNDAQPPDVSLVDVTPDLAQVWLDHNTRNRYIRQSTVEAYARDMAAGRWRITGEAFKFAADGTLLDGQHRAKAIVLSGITIKTFVIFNVEIEAQDVMDSGIKRSAGDALHLEGMKNSSRLASAARIALCRQAGLAVGTMKHSNAEIHTFVRENPDLVEAIELLGQLGRSCPIPPSVADYCYWIFSRIDLNDAQRFFEGLASGANLATDNAILVVRRRLTGEYGSVRRITQEERLSLVIRAWNYWRKNQPINRILAQSRSGKIEIPEPI
jgi:hypothetical protein